MKKILFLLLLCATTIQAQTYQNPTFGTVKTMTAPTVTTTPHLGTVEADGKISKITPENLPLSTAATNALELETTVSAGAVSGFALTNNGNGTVNIASGIAYLRATNDPYATIIKYPITAVTNLSLTDNANNYVLVDYNSGSPSITVTTNSSTINTQTNSLAYVIARVGNDLEYLNLVGQNVDPNAKIRIRFLNQEGIRRASGAVLGFSNRNLTLTSSVLFSGLIRINAATFNTASPDTFTLVYNNGSTWTRTAGQTQVNNTQYNVSGTLTTMPNNTFRTDYVYLLPNNPSKLYVVMGTTTYGSLTLAKAAPRPSSLPVELQVLGLEVGRLFIEKSNASISEVQSTFSNDFLGASVPEHNALTGLQGGTAGEYNHLTNAQVGLVNGSEQIANKSSSYTASSTTTYANTKALVDGLSTKQNTLTNPITGTGTTNTIPKFTGTGVISNSNLSDNGTIITSSTDLSINGLRVGRGTGNLGTNAVIGMSALASNTTGDFNVAIGQNALNGNTTGGSNMAIGGNSMQSNTSGVGNSALGVGALNGITTGNSNVSLGNSSMFFAGNSTDNTAIGSAALYRLANSNGNTAIGFGAGWNIVGGSNLTSSTNSIFIGKGSKAGADSQDNQIAIGYNSEGLGSNTTVIGNSSTTQTWLSGNLTVGTSTNNGNAGRFAGTVDVNKLQLNTTPATASGTPPLLTWNSSTKDVESVPYATFAATASPAFTGTPTAPTATAGTNTTQIATTAFVLANTNATGLLEFDSGGGTIWNNGKNNISSNTSFGENALTSGSLSGTNNTGYGDGALRYLTSGSNNIALGGLAGAHSSAGFASMTTGSTSIFIGNNTRALGNGNNNEIVFGHNAEGNGSNSITLGNTSIAKTILRGVITYTTEYTVATLPTPTEKAFAVVTDALTPTYLGVLVGGGSVVCPVFYNGTAWVSH